jgi:type I restriction enzyme S subunit
VVSHLATIVPDISIVDPDYLYFWSLTYDPRDQAQTTSLPSLPTSLIKAARLALPPLAEQRRIVDLLSRAENIVRLRREAQRKAAELIPAIFLDMFGDPATNSKRWPVLELGDLITEGPQNGLYKHKSCYGTGTPILRIDGFYEGVVRNLASLQRVRIESDEAQRFGLAEGDIVINRVNSPEYLGKSALIPALAEATVFESNMMRLRIDTARIAPGYVIALLQTEAIRSQILARAKHAINQSSINQQDVKVLRVPLPSLELQRRFIGRAEAVRGIVTRQSAALATAQATFDALLHQAFA